MQINPFKKNSNYTAWMKSFRHSYGSSMIDSFKGFQENDLAEASPALVII